MNESHGNSSDYNKSHGDKLDDFLLAQKLSKSTDIFEKLKFNDNYISEIEGFFKAPYEKRVILIQPVRNAKEEEPEHVTRFIEESKNQGKFVYIPKIYNFQQDETGEIELCNTTRFVMEKSKAVAVLYSPDSEGVKVDFGMSVYGNKDVTLLNANLADKLLNADTEKNDSLYEYLMIKSNLMQDIRGFVKDGEEIIKLFKKDREQLKPLKIEFNYVARENNYPALSLDTAVQFGIAYASRYPFRISNIDVVKHQLLVEERTHTFKSYSRIASKLHKLYNPDKK
jgi:hypothetical protein